MILNLDKVGDCAAIANISRDVHAGTCVARVNKPARNELRARKLLGGLAIDEVYAQAKVSCTPAELDPFSLSAGEASVVVPAKITSIICNGMSAQNDGASRASLAKRPADFDQFAFSEELADLPPEAAEAAQFYADLQRESSSFQTLETCWRLVVAFCVRWNRRLLPLSVSTAIGIVTRMAFVGYSYGYIRNVRWCISKAHRMARLPDPTLDDAFRAFLKEIAKRLGTKSKHRKAAILFHHLRRIGELAFAKAGLKSLQEWTAIDLEWFSALRRENLVDLNIEDFKRVPRGYEVHVRRGKNHQYAPRDFFIGPIPNDPLVCPVASLDRWFKVIGETEGPLFRHIGPGGTLTKERLSGRTLTRSVKYYMQELGMSQDDYSSTSLRSGLITQALINRVDQAALRELTGHECVESLDPYYSPGELAPNLSIAATYGTLNPEQQSRHLVCVSCNALMAEVSHAAA